MFTRLRPLLAVAAVWAALTSPAPAANDRAGGRGGYIVTVDGATLAERAPDTPFVPASTIKLATALTALSVLGPDHRIRTGFYLRDGALLCIRGYGDPFLVSERVAEIAASLKQSGIQHLDGLILDDSYFSLDGPADGSGPSVNPYDARNGALAVNFNTVPLVKHDSGIVVSPEPQTPVLDLTRAVARGLAPGRHRVNVSAFEDELDADGPLRYAAELFSALLAREGISVSGTYERGRVNGRDIPVLTYHSRKTIADMVRDCLRYSSNFVANQLFLYCGAVRFGPPATWEKGRRALAETLAGRYGLDPIRFTVVEGSGLSRRNRITPRAMIDLLDAFRPYAALLPVRDDIPLKSGTLSDVFAYAGYFRFGASLDPFVILLNRRDGDREALLVELHGRYLQRRRD